VRFKHLVPTAVFGLAVCVVHAQDFGNTVPNPQNPQRQAANEALAAHDFPRALQLLAPLAAASPSDAQLLYDLGSAQDALDQAGPAETSYRAAIADNANLITPRVALGLLLARNGQLAQARVELVAATGLSAPTDGAAQKDANLLKARAYRALARIDQKTRPGDARDELLAALKLTPETPEDTLLAAELAEAATGGAAAAEAEYRKLLASDPSDPSAAASLAHLMIEQKRLPEAQTLLETSLKENPGNPALTTQLASILIAQGKPADAIQLVEPVHAAHPGDADITHLLAGLYLEGKDYLKAEPLLAALAIDRPKDVSVVIDRADALIHLRRYAEAEQVLARVVAQPALFGTPAELGNAAGALAFASSENNDPEGALHAVAVRATVLPSSPSTLFLTAISQDKLHHFKLAAQAYKDFLAASNGALPDQEFEARHRLVALDHMK
jgi:predicted Zn-dependent protease